MLRIFENNRISRNTMNKVHQSQTNFSNNNYNINSSIIINPEIKNLLRSSVYLTSGIQKQTLGIGENRISTLDRIQITNPETSIYRTRILDSRNKFDPKFETQNLNKKSELTKYCEVQPKQLNFDYYSNGGEKSIEYPQTTLIRNQDKSINVPIYQSNVDVHKIDTGRIIENRVR